jgi:bacterioferritin
VAYSLPDLVDKAVEKELDAGMRYVWQYLTAQNLDIKNDFRDNAIRKFRQAMKVGEHLLVLGEVPVSAPENIGRSLKEMIDIDMKAENETMKLYRDIIAKASKEGDETTRKLFENILIKEKERKTLLKCAQGRATKKLI